MCKSQHSPRHSTRLKCEIVSFSLLITHTFLTPNTTENVCQIKALVISCIHIFPMTTNYPKQHNNRAIENNEKCFLAQTESQELSWKVCANSLETCNSWTHIHIPFHKMHKYWFFISSVRNSGTLWQVSLSLDDSKVTL